MSRLTVLSIILLLSCSMVVPAGFAKATEANPSAETPEGAAGLEAASWLVTLPYGALKVGVALAGGIVGGMAYAISGGNLKTAQSVWTTTMYGTYVITPEHLKGQKPVHFIGVAEEEATPSVKSPSAMNSAKDGN